MPELPDVTVYVDRLAALFGGQKLEGLRVASPFVLRTYDPPTTEIVGRRLVRVSNLGKRLVLEFEGPRFVVVHLMVAGRLKLRAKGEAVPKKVGQFALDFETATVLLTEVSKKKRASLHLFRTAEEVQQLDRGGIDPLTCSPDEFRAALTRENRTLKRAFTDPRLLSGIGNAYSDEIFFWAQASPVTRTHGLKDDDFVRLFVATRHTLRAWTRLLAREVGDGFPEKVTAFREEMAVHGRFGKPCRVCGTTIQRIRYADNETNYCPRCQTAGRVLADRSLSQLLHKDFPRTLDDLEETPGIVGGASRRVI